MTSSSRRGSTSRRTHPTSSTGSATRPATGRTSRSARIAQWSGVAKITNRSIPNVSLSYQAIVNSIEGRRSTYSFIRNPDGLTRQETWSITHGVDITHTLEQVDLLQSRRPPELLALHRLCIFRLPRSPLRRGRTAADRLERRGRVHPGRRPQSVRAEDRCSRRQGRRLHADEHRTISSRSAARCSSRGSRSVSPAMSITRPASLIRHINEPPDYPGVQNYEPVLAAAYAQDQMEWSDLTIRLGGRLEYFDARATVPSDLANPANTIAGAPDSRPRPTTSEGLFRAAARGRLPDHGPRRRALRLRALLPVPRRWETSSRTPTTRS